MGCHVGVDGAVQLALARAELRGAHARPCLGRRHGFPGGSDAGGVAHRARTSYHGRGAWGTVPIVLRRNPKIVSLDPPLQAAAGVTPNVFALRDARGALSSAPMYLEQLGVTPEGLEQRVIGRGAYAVAFILPDGTVLKLTTDADDAHAAELVRRAGPAPGLIQVLDVRRFAEPVEERGWDALKGIWSSSDKTLYAIVSEPVRPLHRYDKLLRGGALDVTSEEGQAALARRVLVELIDAYGPDALADDYLVGRAIVEVESFNEYGEEQLRRIAEGYRWLADHGYDITDLHAGNFGLSAGNRLVLFDFGHMSGASAEVRLPIDLAANPGLQGIAAKDIQVEEEGEHTVVTVKDRGYGDAGGAPGLGPVTLRFRMEKDRKIPTPIEDWHPDHRGFPGYYTWDSAITIEEILRRWVEHGAKVRQGLATSFELPTGEYFDAIFEARELYPHRRDDRPFSEKLAKMLVERGWLSPPLLIFGRNGCIELGEGNHRVQAAYRMGLEAVPVRVWLVQNAVCPTALERLERARSYERGRALEDRERGFDYFAQFYDERPLKFNPKPQEMPRVEQHFDDCFDEVEETFPDVGTIELHHDDRAADDNGAGSERQFGYCMDGSPIVIAFAAKAEALPDTHIRGLMAHEFGHALEYRYGVEELEKRLGKLPPTVEARADAIAERVFGDTIRYDDACVQCVGCAGTSPRPSHLAKNRGR